MFNSLFRKKSISTILSETLNGHGDGHAELHKTLKVKDLVAFGIAAIIGAGIFSTIGRASADGGPAVIFLFIFTAIACGFTAFAYAEFAGMVPVSGSAYTYAYVAFGELIAWIIGWSLIMEYAIGNITIAISWSDYLTSLLRAIDIPALGIHGINLPGWLTMDYLSAYNGYNHAQNLMHAGKQLNSMNEGVQAAYNAWRTAPAFGNFHFVADIPALAIIIFITWLVYRGMKESKRASNLMVVVKLCVILLVISIGVFYIDVRNWNPFAPNGVSGILKGISAVFFAYIGFDAISTTAEECENPQRDLPRGMMWAIIICTVLYVVIALVLTGIVNYKYLAVGDPLAYVFEKINFRAMSFIVGVSAVFAMSSVLLVFQLGQPRIWMSMSRDGLLPKKFSKIHPRYKTPSFSTIVVGFVVAVPTLFLNLTIVTDLTSIGTLFAFIVVCAGVLIMQNDENVPRGKFRTPYVNSRYIFPAGLILAFAIVMFTQGPQVKAFMLNSPRPKAAAEIITGISAAERATLTEELAGFKPLSAVRQSSSDAEAYLSTLSADDYNRFLNESKLPKDRLYNSGISLFWHKVPTWIFMIACVALAVWCYRSRLSLIPVLGLVSCLYMISELGIVNWIGFGVWLLIGLLVYFLYGYKHSKLRNNLAAARQSATRV